MHHTQADHTRQGGESEGVVAMVVARAHTRRRREVNGPNSLSPSHDLSLALLSHSDDSINNSSDAAAADATDTKDAAKDDVREDERGKRAEKRKERRKRETDIVSHIASNDTIAHRDTYTH